MIRARQLLCYAYRDDFRSLIEAILHRLAFRGYRENAVNVSGENLYRGRVFWLYRTQLRARLGSWGDW